MLFGWIEIGREKKKKSKSIIDVKILEMSNN
jgi:hypothetical protein